MRNTLLSTHVIVFSLSLSSGVRGADSDSDGVDDALDLCCNTPTGVPVDVQGRPKADLDGDCDVDQSDFAIFQVSMTGPMTCPPSGCTCACPVGVANCNGVYTDGCEVLLDTNPPCNPFTDLGSVAGDQNADIVSHDGQGERWYRFTLAETTTVFDKDLNAIVSLTPPAGTNYDLAVYCVTCGSVNNRSSVNLGSAIDTVSVRHADETGNDNITMLINVKYTSGDGCGNYHLQIAGNVGGGALMCP